MLNIFNISLHRSGTQSAHDLFRRTGCSSIHWAADVDGVNYQEMVTDREDDIDFVAEILTPVFKKFTAVNDAPISALYRPLSAKYPHAKFFAFRRSATGWVRSVRRHIGSRAFVPFERVVYWSFFRQKPATLSELSDSELINFHDWHHSQITTHFGSSPKVLILSLDGKGLGPRLCEFCGLPPVPLRVVDFKLGHNLWGDPADIDAKVCD